MGKTQAVRETDYHGSYVATAWISGLYTLAAAMLGLGGVTIDEPSVEQAMVRAFAAFCVVTYVSLVFSVAFHQNRDTRTLRATVYFWLLALLPLWSIPVFWLLWRIICRPVALVVHRWIMPV